MSPPPTLDDLQAHLEGVQQVISRLVLEPGLAAHDWASELEALHGVLALLRWYMQAQQRELFPLEAQP